MKWMYEHFQFYVIIIIALFAFASHDWKLIGEHFRRRNYGFRLNLVFFFEYKILKIVGILYHSTSIQYINKIFASILLVLL